MSKKRTLTHAEMKRVHDEKLPTIQAENPGFEVTVHVRSETDDDGEPIVWIERKRETEG